jgi:uncharacterized membrane protein
MRNLLLATSLLLLSACQAQPDENAGSYREAGPEPTVEVPKLGGLDLGKPLRASGSEPFWMLDIEPGAATYHDYSVETPKPESFAPPSRVVSADRAVFTTRNSVGAPVVITLTAESCLDVGEEENRQPLTVELRIGDQVRTGCAGPKPADADKDETGNAT